MRITILTSNHPSFDHVGCNEYVLASIAKGLIKSGNDVSYAFAHNDSKNIFKKIENVKYIGDFSNKLITKISNNSFERFIKYIKAIFFEPIEDYYFLDPHQIVNQLNKSKPDIYFIFWDTSFEYLIPYLSNKVVFAYYAKPPYESAFVLNNNDVLGYKKSRNYFKKFLINNYLKKKINNHLSRMQLIKQMSNICKQDVNYYLENNVKSEYIPLTTPDSFLSKRNNLYRNINKQSTINIIGGLGNMKATGSVIGFNYLLSNVIPIIRKKLVDHKWVINFYGKGYKESDINRLKGNENFCFKGFVEDIDAEVLNNTIALFFNNAGPYRGTYTRIPYLMSGGICIVAHSNLKKSVPELVHRENILFGKNIDEISKLTVEVIKNKKLAKEIGNNARKTFLRYFSSEQVILKLNNTLKKLI